MELINASPLGKGSWHPAGSVGDAGLMASLHAYRRRVVGAYRAVKPDELGTAIVGGPFHVSPKVDGELWFLVLDSGLATLVGSNGRAISGDIPLLAEARGLAGQAPAGRVVLAGELFAASASKGRPRVGDVASALGGAAQAPVERLGFMAFDLVEGLMGDGAAGSPQFTPYGLRLDLMASLLAAGKRVKAIKTDAVDGVAALPGLFADYVDGGKAEGLIVRSAQGAIYKIKPEFSIDAVVIGYTARTEDPQAVRTLLMGLTRQDGRIQIAGHCGNLGSDTERRTLMQQLKPLDCVSGFRCPSRSGELFSFVKPLLVAEIKVTDLQPETSDGQAVRTMVLAYQPDAGWQAVSTMPSASWLHPVLVRLRDDKKPDPIDTRFAQILERCSVDQAGSEVHATELPASQVLRRQVWTKTTKGKVAVRKLVAWQTNKAEADASYPAYVLHWTDYSAGRAIPLDREVRTAPTPELMEEIAAKLIEDNIKKGWELVV